MSELLSCSQIYYCKYNLCTREYTEYYYWELDENIKNRPDLNLVHFIDVHMEVWVESTKSSEHAKELIFKKLDIIRKLVVNIVYE